MKLTHDYGPEPLHEVDGRDYLRQEPVHCGAHLHLEVLDGQPFAGRDFLVVRYERSQHRAYFVLTVGGHDATISHMPWMRFWWPE